MDADSARDLVDALWEVQWMLYLCGWWRLPAPCEVREDVVVVCGEELRNPQSHLPNGYNPNACKWCHLEFERRVECAEPVLKL